MNFVVLYSTSSHISSGESGQQGIIMSCVYSSSICSCVSRGFPWMSCVYPNCFSFSIDVCTSIGLKCVTGSSEQSYLMVPSLFTLSACFARSIPFARCSGMCSLLLVPRTPFMRSGYCWQSIFFVMSLNIWFMSIARVTYAVVRSCFVHCSSSIPHWAHSYFLVVFWSHVGHTPK